ncbi:hypothetical protein ACQP1G_29400 [Nocardia sp. CA-107356]|uniref:hypothetical protein n=1 Tax=Nocardia sp. CA-107356 TaxID=3239972 RepID=UPI003D90E171
MATATLSSRAASWHEADRLLGETLSNVATVGEQTRARMLWTVEHLETKLRAFMGIQEASYSTNGSPARPGLPANVEYQLAMDLDDAAHAVQQAYSDAEHELGLDGPITVEPGETPPHFPPDVPVVPSIPPPLATQPPSTDPPPWTIAPQQSPILPLPGLVPPGKI